MDILRRVGLADKLRTAVRDDREGRFELLKAREGLTQREVTIQGRHGQYRAKRWVREGEKPEAGGKTASKVQVGQQLFGSDKGKYRSLGTVTKIDGGKVHVSHPGGKYADNNWTETVENVNKWIEGGQYKVKGAGKPSSGKTDSALDKRIDEIMKENKDMDVQEASLQAREELAEEAKGKGGTTGRKGPLTSKDEEDYNAEFAEANGDSRQPEKEEGPKAEHVPHSNNKEIDEAIATFQKVVKDPDMGYDDYAGVVEAEVTRALRRGADNPKLNADHKGFLKDMDRLSFKAVHLMEQHKDGAIGSDQLKAGLWKVMKEAETAGKSLKA